MSVLTERENTLRRFALIATSGCCVALLMGVLIMPIWDAGAGGLERGEQASGNPRQQKNANRTNRAQRLEPHQPRQAARPEPTNEHRASDPIAIPIPRPLPRDTARPQPPSMALPPEPSRVQSPPLPPPDAKLATSPSAETAQPDATWRTLFQRPEPPPIARPDLVALGARLFHEPKLSADHRMSCATCHDPAQSFTDGRRKARGNRGQDLDRNTPSLWNLAEARSFYWDGRAPTLEAQIKDAIERDGEMDATLEAGVIWLRRDPSYVADFTRAFARPNAITTETIVEALAAYERALWSPEVRFDRWIEGDTFALDAREQAGFRLFTGKARCVACHGGWRFTDDRVHDIGLASRDPGRRAIDASAPNRAFKTPSLREAVWSAPYMHDGSLRTFDDVIAHYAGRLEQRDSLAPELKPGIELSATERADLIAFLKTLSSETRPAPPGR